MSNTGTVILSLAVGVAVGYGVAQLTAPSACNHQLFVIDASAGDSELPDRCVSKKAGHRVTWQSSNGAAMEVEWVSIAPTTAPYPYSVDCKNAPTSICQSGPLLGTAVVGSKARYRAKILPNGPVMNGRIIIDR